MTKELGDADPTGYEVVAIPTAAMGEGATMPQETSAVVEYTSISRATGEFVGVYDITITGAKLKASVPAKIEDPANNYIMTVEQGTFEIVNAADYYVSSKFVTREFASGVADVPFGEENQFYLYRAIKVDNAIDHYEFIPETSDLYKEIAASGRITANKLEEATNNAGIQTNRTGNRPDGYLIQPVFTNNDGDAYALAIMPRTSFPTGDAAHEGEGLFKVTPRKVTIIADDQETAFGVAYVTGTGLTAKVYDGELTAADATKLSNVVLVTTNQYAANTIANYAGLSSGIADAVNAATKPLADAVTADIEYAGNLATLQQQNPNYAITFIEGTYTVTVSANKYFVDVTWTKTYGSNDAAVREFTTKFGADKETAETVDNIDVNPIYSFGEADEPTTPGTYTSEDGLTVTGANPYTDGFAVVYDGQLIINAAGEVVITVKTLGAQYPVPPTLSFDNKRVTVTGAEFADIAAKGDFVLTYEKPKVGFIAKGAPVQVKFNGKAYGTADGEVVSADDWAWVANYKKVTVKSGNVRVTAPEDITLDIVAFNKAKYDGEFDTNEQLIKDYAGTKVNSVIVKCSQQGTEAEEANQYTVKANQWYSMVLPFDASVRDIQKLFNGFVGVDRLQKKTSPAAKASEIRFYYTTKDIPANEPFLAQTDQDFVFAPVKIEKDGGIEIECTVDEVGNIVAAVEDAENGNQFVGTYKAFFADDATSYDLINLSAGAVSPANVNAYVRPLGAYIKVAEGVANNEARIFIEEGDGSITAINAVTGDVIAKGAEGMYNLNGMKMNTVPTQKGVYIINGKKVVIK